ncbi:hypothetical protein NSMM_150113 [Nitrosomonas mobilis]|uniref:Uncharacterized protein n=1 Tax=Nitrosomonas mobilis TaxID=51642 RepID=A0A1G5SB01_9PROT|nr:hypothetical protein NSMM_150113 [Nitrosomonas mobilis]
MSECTKIERPFLQQLKSLGWEIIDQGQDISSGSAKNQRASFR